MKFTNRLIVQKYMTAVTILAFFMAMSPNSSAKHGASKPTPEPASVIAHVALPGITVRQLDLQQNGSKQYLYVEEVSKDGFAILDVTKPGQPDFIKSEAWPNEASTGKLQMVSGQLASAEAPDVTVETVFRTETLKVLDLSDPANPRTILTFSGVTSTLTDDAHNLVYITNSDGLWILKHQSEQMSSAHECSSEDASNDLATCQ